MDEEVGGIVGDAAGFRHVLTDYVDVANLAARLVVLSIEVDLRLWVALHHFANALRHGHLRIFFGAQHISHHRDRSQGCGRAQRQVQYGTQVLLKLGGHAAILSPVAGIVRAHGQLVDGDILLNNRARRAGGGSNDGAGVLLRGEGKELHRQHAGNAKFGGHLDAHLHGALGQLRRKVRGGGKSLGADAVPLHGLGDRPDLHLAGGAAGDEHGQLAGEVDLFFGHERGIGRKQLSDERLQLLRGREPHAMAVVAAAAGFEAHETVDKRGEVPRILHRFDGGKARHWGAQLCHFLAHEQLVLRVEEGGRLGLDVEAVGDERLHVLGGNVLVLKGDCIRAFCGGGEHVEIVIVTENDVRDHLCGGLFRSGGQHAQVDVELGGGRLHHACKLAVSINSNEGFVLFTHSSNTSLGAMIVRHTIFQNSLMTALLDGIYDGEMTIGELLGKGNFGIGTFDALDGEMIILDGVCYQLRGDGTATVADLDQGTPFAVATNFVPRIKVAAPKGLRREELSAFIDEVEPSANFMYAVRISGRFSNVVTRTVVKQSKPYPPMAQAVGGDKELRFDYVEGVIGGFRTPVFEKGISVPGCHVHFIDAARTSGGHVLDYTVDEAMIELCPGTDLDLRLPLTHEFRSANLAPEDLDQQLHTTEIKD